MLADQSAAAASGPARVTGSGRTLALCLLPVLLLPLFYEISAWRAAGASGFPLDDAWIHAQFARNLATGHGFTYTGTHWVAGSTSPAWTMLIALGFVLVPSVLLSAKLLGALLQIASAMGAAKLAFHLSGSRTVAITGGLVVGALPAMSWGVVSGMEVPLSSALVLAGSYAYLTAGSGARRLLAAICLLCLACLARPESLVLLGLVVIHALARAGSARAALRTAASILIVAAIVLGPFVLFDYVTTGRPLPTTFYAKSGPGIVRAISDGDAGLLRVLLVTHGPNAVRRFVETLWDQLGAATVIVIAGAVAAFAGALRRRGAGLLLIAVVVSAFAMGLVAPQRLKPENFRYTAQLLGLAVVVGLAGLSFWWRLLASRAVRAAILAACVACAAYGSIRSAPLYALSVKNILELHVVAAEWMRAHLPPGATIAANDVGALAFFSGHEVIDLEGLVSPEALAFGRAERGIGFATRTQPDYVAIFPGWYPDIVNRPDLFREVRRFSIPDNFVSAGSELVVYSTPWTRYWPSAEPLARTARRRWPV